MEGAGVLLRRNGLLLGQYIHAVPLGGATERLCRHADSPLSHHHPHQYVGSPGVSCNAVQAARSPNYRVGKHCHSSDVNIISSQLCLVTFTSEITVSGIRLPQLACHEKLVTLFRHFKVVAVSCSLC